ALSAEQIFRGVVDAERASPLGSTEGVVQEGHVRTHRLPARRKRCRQMGRGAMKLSHLAPHRGHEIGRQDLRPDIVEGRLLVEDSPLSSLPIGKYVAVLLEDRSKEPTIPRPLELPSPLMNETVILTEVHIRPVGRRLRDVFTTVVDAHRKHTVGRDIRADVTNSDERPGPTEVRPGFLENRYSFRNRNGRKRHGVPWTIDRPRTKCTS